MAFGDKLKEIFGDNSEEEKNYTPEDLRPWMIKQGYAVANQGTTWNGIFGVSFFFSSFFSSTTSSSTLSSITSSPS